jgi:glucose/arabinose dehydrogenase
MKQWLNPTVAALVVAAVIAPLHVSAQRGPGAPPPGSGPIDFSGFARVIDGNSLEVRIDGNRVGIAILGIDAPAINTPCGLEAANLLQALLLPGSPLPSLAGMPIPGLPPVRFEEDPDLQLSFDIYKRRLYHVNVATLPIAVEMVRAGVARADGKGYMRAILGAAEREARAEGRGCLWRRDVPPRGPRAGSAPAEAPPDAEAANQEEPLPAVVDSVDAAKAYRTATATAEPVTAAVEPNAAVSVPAGFIVETIALGLDLPTAFAFLPDGRILIAEKRGVVRVYKNGTLLPTPFIDITNRVNSYWDRGMLGVAADPNFATNGYVYLLYTYENDSTEFAGPKTARLTRVTASGDTASPASETVILGNVVGRSCNDFPATADCIASDSISHTVGNLKFHPDGTLFVTTGDGASFNVVDDDALRAQNVDLLTGKVLHVTTSGAGISSNPFWDGNANANRSKVYARGLRNSYRFNLRPSNSVLYSGDVGWDTREEINVIPSGVNLGWPCYEGSARQSGYEPKPACQSLYAQGAAAVRAPMYEWQHAGVGSAATGGAFYSGTAYPAEYQGAYFFADQARSLIKYLKVSSTDTLSSGPFDFASGADNPVDIEMGPDGKLYYLAIATGELRAFRHSSSPDIVPPQVSSTDPATGGSSVSPLANVTATFTEAMTGSTITSTTFTVVRQGTSTPLAATVTYDPATVRATLNPSADLQPGAIYIATVKGGVAGVRDAAGNALGADHVWTFSVVPLPASGSSFLSNLPWIYMTNGWGPAEIDRSNGEANQNDGVALKLNNVTYQKGFGVHANSELRFYLGGTCSTFTAKVGVDDEVVSGGSVVFQVAADGTVLYTSPTLTGTSATQNVSVSVTGKTELRLLVTDGGNGIGADHGDWADAQLQCSADTVPPTVLGTVPLSGATNVSVTDPVRVTFSEPMNASTTTTTTFTLIRQGTSTPVAASVTYDSATRVATLTPAAALQVSSTYTATVKSGTTGVKDVAGNALASDYVWSFSTSATAPPPTTTSYLSDLPYTVIANGWGPAEKDRSNGEDLAGDGNVLTLNGVTYSKGIGVHATSEIRYTLGGGCSTFTAFGGIDDEVAAGGSVLFQVWADGVKLDESAIMTATSASKAFNVNIAGRAELRLIVTDGGDGAGADHADWADAKLSCSNNTPPTATITAPASTLTYKVGDVINYSGSASDVEDGSIPPASLSWSIRIQHCPGGVCHTHTLLTATGATGSFTVPDHGDESHFEIVLEATDSGGLKGTKTVNINPQTVQVTLNTVPPGLQVVYGGTSAAAPVTYTTIVNSTHTISAPTPQGQAVFSSWSDGGAAQHNIVMGATNATYTATFVDNTPPTITAVSPAANATGVALNTTVTATFSEAMNASTINAATFTLVPQGSTTPIAATVTYAATTRVATLAPSAALQAGTTYTATVRGGASGVKDAANNPLASDSTWSFTTTTTTPPPGTTSYLSDLAYQAISNGWGPVEKDRSNGEDAANDGAIITLAGVQYPKGLGVHAASEVRYNMGGTCSTFTAATGIDDEVIAGGSVIFQVWADGVKLDESPIMRRGSATRAVSVSVAGRSQLSLIVTDAGDGNGADHADWADAKLTCAADTTPPTVTAISPANGATGVALTPNVTATFSEAMTAATINTTTFTLVRQSNGAAVTVTVTYDPATRRATLRPTAALARLTVYQVRVRSGASGVKDANGNALATDRTWTFTTRN